MPFEWDVFVSYSSRDGEFVKMVVRDLELAGLKVWWDNTAIQPAERIRDAVNRGLEGSASILIFISSRSLASGWVLNELSLAMRREIEGKRSIVIPVLIGRVRLEDLPPDIRDKKCIDLRGKRQEKYSAVKGTLLSAIALAANRPDVQPRVSMIVGDELADFFLQHHFTQASEVEVLPELVTKVFGDSLVSVLEEGYDQETDGSYRDAYDEFVKAYGTYTLRKMALYYLDTERVSLTGGFEEEDIDGALSFLHAMVAVFSTQRAIESQIPFAIRAGLDNEGSSQMPFAIRAGLDNEGNLGFWLEAS